MRLPAPEVLVEEICRRWCVTEDGEDRAAVARAVAAHPELMTKIFLQQYYLLDEESLRGWVDALLPDPVTGIRMIRHDANIADEALKDRNAKTAIELLRDGEIDRLYELATGMFSNAAPREIFELPGIPLDKRGQLEVLSRLITDRVQTNQHERPIVNPITLENVSSSSQRIAFALLEFMADPEARGVQRLLSIGLLDPAAVVRIAVLRAAKEFSHDEAMQDLIASAAEDEDADVRRAAIDALLPAIAAGQASEYIEAFLEDEAADIRLKALLAVQEHGIWDELRVELVSFAYDSNAEVRETARRIFSEQEIEAYRQALITVVPTKMPMRLFELRVVAIDDQIPTEQREELFRERLRALTYPETSVEDAVVTLKAIGSMRDLDRMSLARDVVEFAARFDQAEMDYQLASLAAKLSQEQARQLLREAMELPVAKDGYTARLHLADAYSDRFKADQKAASEMVVVASRAENAHHVRAAAVRAACRSVIPNVPGGLRDLLFDVTSDDALRVDIVRSLGDAPVTEERIALMKEASAIQGPAGELAAAWLKESADEIARQQQDALAQSRIRTT